MIKRKDIVIIISAVVATVILILVLVNLPGKGLLFYYPDRDYNVLHHERRNVEFKKDDYDFVNQLIHRYLLGPIRYDLTLDLNQDTLLLNVWTVNIEDKPKAVIMNLGGNFSNDVYLNNETYYWMIEGLKKTLHENTQMEELYILSYGEDEEILIGDYNIGYPIHIQ